MEEAGDGVVGPATLRPDGRLPYEKPSVTWEQPLEAQPSLMAGCQKQGGGGDDCGAVFPLSS